MTSESGPTAYAYASTDTTGRDTSRHADRHPTRNTRRAFLGGMLIAGACAANRAHAAGGSGSGSGSAGPAPARAAADAKGGARHPLRHRQTAAHPQGYRLRPQAGEVRSGGRGSTSVTHTLRSGAREIALTFDDGPDPHYTPQVLEVLRRWDVRATFCVVGRDAEAHPRLLNAMADAGHAIANHSWSHALLTRMRPDELYEQLARTCDVLDEAVGTAPSLARAPFGAWNERALEMSASLGMSPLGWSVDTCDWEEPGARKITSTVLERVRSGSIVLNHDGGGDRSQTVAALRDYLPRLIDHGYVPVLPSSSDVFADRAGAGAGAATGG